MLATTIVLVILSLVQFFSIITNIALVGPLIVVMGTYAFLLLRIRKMTRFSVAIPGKMALLWLILMGIAINFFQKYVFPWGGWDAIAIWNQHAKFLVDPQHWQLMFERTLASSHPDYPLFVPSFVSLVWAAMGNTHFIVPMIMSLFPLLGIITILFYGTTYRFIGILGALAILLDKEFIDQSASQYADTWVAYFLLLGIYLLVQLPNKNLKTVWMGLLISSICWVKNEGLIIYILVSIGVIYEFRKDKVQMTRYLLGSLPIILTIITYKLGWSPQNDMVSESDASLINKLLTVDRYKTIAQFAVKTIKSSYILVPGMVILGLALVKQWPMKLTTSAMVLSCLLFVYLGIYLVTPKDLTWHLETSFFRLFHQIYPGLVLCFLLLMDHNQGTLADR